MMRTSHCFAIVAVLAVASTALVACGKHEDHTNKDSGASPPSSLDHARECVPTFSLELDGVTPLAKRAEIPAGRYQLKSMRMHMLDRKTNNSYEASAAALDDFTVKVDCQSILPVAGDTNTGEFSVAQIIDTAKPEDSSLMRELSVAFKDGLPDSKGTRLKQKDFDASEMDSMPLDRVPLGGGNFITFRFYSTSATSLELRIKFEFKVGANGAKAVELTQAIYERI
jgi:hypothetical protein